MAVVAADALDDTGLHLGPVIFVRLDTFLIDDVGEVRRLAGPAVGHRMRTGRVLDVHNIIVVAARAAVVLGKAVSLVKCAEHGVLLEVIDDLVAFAGHVPGGVDFRILLRPVCGVQNRDAGVRLNLLCDLFDLYDGTAEDSGVEPAVLERIKHSRLDTVGRKRRA